MEKAKTARIECYVGVADAADFRDAELPPDSTYELILNHIPDHAQRTITPSIDS